MFLYLGCFLLFSFFSFIEDSRIPITVDWWIVDREVITVRGSLCFMVIVNTHDLVNSFMMKSEVKISMNINKYGGRNPCHVPKKRFPTNICLIEDLENERVVAQYRALERNHWSGYAFRVAISRRASLSMMQL